MEVGAAWGWRRGNSAWVGRELEKKRLFDARKWKGIVGEESMEEKGQGTVRETFVVASRAGIRRVTSLVCQLEDQDQERDLFSVSAGRSGAKS